MNIKKICYKHQSVFLYEIAAANSLIVLNFTNGDMNEPIFRYSTMNKIIFVCLAMFFATGCNKKSEGLTLVQYQVIATNSSKIEITYNNIIGNKVIVSVTDYWAFDVPNPTKPYTAFVQASSSSPFSSITTTCIVNILVNSTVVKTDTVTSNTIATAQAEYILQ